MVKQLILPVLFLMSDSFKSGHVISERLSFLEDLGTRKLLTFPLSQAGIFLPLSLFSRSNINPRLLTS